MSEYEGIPHLAFNWTMVTYFFFGGLSAGAYFFSVAANYWKREFKPLAKTAAILAPITVAIGMFMLFIDIGKPLRVWRLYLVFNPKSAISYGAFILVIYFFVSSLYAFLLTKGEDEKAKKTTYLGLPCALFVSIYTGVLLSQAPGKALWHTALVPWLFLVGGLISGMALVMMVSAGRVETALLKKLGRVLGFFILLELGMVASEIFILIHGGIGEVATVTALLSGQYSFLFWGVEMLLGVAVPLFILFRTRSTAGAYAVASMLILIGIYAMRYIVVIGAQSIG